MANVIKKVGGVARSKLGTPITGSSVVVNVFAKTPGTPDKYDILLAQGLSDPGDGSWEVFVEIDELEKKVLCVLHHEDFFEGDDDLAGSEFVPLSTCKVMRQLATLTADTAITDWDKSNTGVAAYQNIDSENDTDNIYTAVQDAASVYELMNLTITGATTRIRYKLRMLAEDVTGTNGEVLLDLTKSDGTAITPVVSANVSPSKAGIIEEVVTDWINFPSIGTANFGNLCLKASKTSASGTVRIYHASVEVESDDDGVTTTTTTTTAAAPLIELDINNLDFYFSSTSNITNIEFKVSGVWEAKFDNSFWGATRLAGNGANGEFSWDGTKWAATVGVFGSYIDCRLTASGTWKEGYRPTHIRITCTNSCDLEVGNVVDNNGGIFSGSYTSGTELALDFTAPVASDPTIEPAEGGYPADRLIFIDGTGAKYTTDGSDPTDLSPDAPGWNVGIGFTPGTPIKARCYRVNYNPSNIVSKTYTVVTPVAWDVRTAVEVPSKKADITQDGHVVSVAFSVDGTKMYVLGQVNNSVYQYTLSTAWDPGTATYDSVSFVVQTEDAYPYEIKFKPDGTKMYLLGVSGDKIYQYTLSTPWDLSTISYDTVTFDYSVQDINGFGFHFKPDGTKFFMLGTFNDNVYSYTLSTPWDLSTCTYDSVSFDISAVDSSPSSLSFSEDGYVMYMNGGGDSKVYQFTLSVPWDISTAILTSDIMVKFWETIIFGLCFKPDGTVMYLAGSSNDRINYFKLT